MLKFFFGWDQSKINQKILSDNEIPLVNTKLAKIKNDNEILSKKILSYEKNKLKEENKNKEINNELYKEIEILKKENLDIKNNNEKLNKEINEIMNKNKTNENENNSEILKGQNEELEGLRQLNLQYENEINSLKKENEKIKGQLIRLSKTLPEIIPPENSDSNKFSFFKIIRDCFKSIPIFFINLSSLLNV